jgi:hypothetical protein
LSPIANVEVGNPSDRSLDAWLGEFRGYDVFTLNDREKQNGLPWGRPLDQIRSSASIDDGLVVVPVAIPIVVLLDDDSVPIPVFVAIADDRAVVVSIAVAVMARTDRYAGRSDTNTNFFRARRHRGTKTGNGSNYQSVFHLILPIS